MPHAVVDSPVMRIRKVKRGIALKIGIFGQKLLKEHTHILIRERRKIKNFHLSSACELRGVVAKPAFRLVEDSRFESCPSPMFLFVGKMNLPFIFLTTIGNQKLFQKVSSGRSQFLEIRG